MRMHIELLEERIHVREPPGVPRVHGPAPRGLVASENADLSLLPLLGREAKGPSNVPSERNPVGATALKPVAQRVEPLLHARTIPQAVSRRPADEAQRLSPMHVSENSYAQTIASPLRTSSSRRFA